jgi:hypothetical protein
VQAPGPSYGMCDEQFHHNVDSDDVNCEFFHHYDDNKWLNHSRWQFHSSKNDVQCQCPGFFFCLMSGTDCQGRAPFSQLLCPLCSHSTDSERNAFSFEFGKQYTIWNCICNSISVLRLLQGSTCGTHAGNRVYVTLG